MTTDLFSKKYQIFISSTYSDLISAREGIIKMLLNLYQIPIGMEMFSADNDEQWETIRNTIDNSDYYVLILGQRYGSETKEGVSYTEKEYEYAKLKAVPVLAFIRNVNAPTKPTERENNPVKTSKQESFRGKVIDNAIVDFWEEETELINKVTIALTKAFARHPRTGWVRGDQAMSPRISEEVAILSKENRELKEQLSAINHSLPERSPIFQVQLNGAESLEILKRSLPEKFHINGLFRKLDYQTIDPDLQPFVSIEEVEKFNMALNEKIEDANAYNDWSRQQELFRLNAFSITMTLKNIGNVLAQRVTLEMKVPEEFVIQEKIQPYEIYPEIPGIENVLLRAFKRKKGGVMIESLQSSTKYPQRNISNYHHDPLHEGNLHFLQSTRVRYEVHSLLHTQEKSPNLDFFLIPLKAGYFNIQMTVICEEIWEPQVLEFPIVVVE